MNPVKEICRDAAGLMPGMDIGKEPDFPGLDEDPKAILFSEGAEWLRHVTGRGPASIRGAIGQMLRAEGHDDAGVVLAVLRDAKRRAVAEPVAWIMGVLKARSPNRAVINSARPSNFKLSKPAARA